MITIDVMIMIIMIIMTKNNNDDDDDDDNNIILLMIIMTTSKMIDDEIFFHLQSIIKGDISYVLSCENNRYVIAISNLSNIIIIT